MVRGGSLTIVLVPYGLTISTLWINNRGISERKKIILMIVKTVVKTLISKLTKRLKQKTLIMIVFAN